jgi:hypothetical protein
MAQYVFGIRFYLRSAVAQDTSVGIYTVGGSNSQIRLIEDDISALSPTVAWKSGLLRENAPFDAFEESMTLDDGGCMPEIGGSTVHIANGAQFDKTITAAGINFVGLVTEIVMFEIVNGALVDPDGTVFRRRIADAPSWDEYDYAIPLKDARIKRRANLSTLISTTTYPNAEGSVIGKSTPVTVGKLWSPIGIDGLFTRNSFAKLIRVANKQTTFCNNEYTYHGQSMFTPKDQYVFPLVVMATGGAPLTYGIQLGTALLYPYTEDDVIQWTDYYMYIVEGDGSGEYRKITSYVRPWSTLILTVTVSDYFSKTLQGNTTATATGQAWVSFVKISRQYLADEWPCIGFLDDVGNPVVNGQNAIYAYSDDKNVTVAATNTKTPVQVESWDFRKIPEWAFAANLAGNLLTVDLKYFNGSIDQVESVIIIPCKNVGLFGDGNVPNDKDMTPFITDDDIFEWNHYRQIPFNIPGYFSERGFSDYAGFLHVLPYMHPETLPYTIDKNGLTAWQCQVNTNSVWILGSEHVDYAFALYAIPPTISNQLLFDNVYFMIKSDSTTQTQPGVTGNFHCNARIVYTRFLGNANAILPTATGDWYYDLGNNYALPPDELGEIKDQLDSYLGDATNNKNFFLDVPVTSGVHLICGKGKFQIPGITDIRTYQSIQSFLLCVHHKYDTTYQARAVWNVYELAVMFQKSLSISDAVYAQFSGRNFGGATLDTWNSRKTAADPILYLTDWAEMVARLQDWSETGEVKDWGHEYATAPLIETGNGEGGFDSIDLTDWQTMPIAYQNEDYGNCWTDVLLREIAARCFLTFYQDPVTGKERIGNIAKRADTTPTTTITLADIIGPIGRVSEPSAVNIYCEPLIRYKKNRGSGAYEGLLAITNSSAATYDPAYVSGVTGTDTAELLWTMAHVLRLNVDQVVPPPSDITDNNFIYDEYEAVKLMLIWLSWMGATNVDGTPASVIYQPKQRLLFSVPLELGKDWFISKHINIQLPFHTNNSVTECVIERLSTKISQGEEEVAVQVVTYGLTDEIALFIQDTYATVSEDWQDHMQTEAERGEGHADVQGIM